jgi:hypothetical protein
MSNQTWTFLRLIWGEWASRVTGSLSAILVLIGLSISFAGAAGARIPADSIIQLATWIFAAICGGQAACSVWAREHWARVVAEEKLKPCGLRLQFDSEAALTSDPPGQLRRLLFASITNETANPLDRVMLQAVITAENGGEYAYPLREPFSLLVDENKRVPVLEYNLEVDRHLVLPIFWRKTNDQWTREPGGVSSRRSCCDSVPGAFFCNARRAPRGHTKIRGEPLAVRCHSLRWL